MLYLLNSASIWAILALCFISMLGTKRDTRNWSISFTFITFIVIALSLYLADTVQGLDPTTGTVLARWLIVVSLFLISKYVRLVTCKLSAYKAEIEYLRKGKLPDAFKGQIIKQPKLRGK